MGFGYSKELERAVPEAEQFSGTDLCTVSRIWDPKLLYFQDPTPEARYARVEEQWKNKSGDRVPWKERGGWEYYLATHSLYHYAKMAHCRTKSDERFYSQKHYEMYCWYEMMLPLLFVRTQLDTANNMTQQLVRMMKRMYFGPRGGGKSIGLRIALIWLKFHDPTLTTIYAKALAEDAERCVDWMRKQYLTNPFIRQYYPDFYVKAKNLPKPWSKSGFILPDTTGVTDGKTDPELTFTAGGVNREVTGQHYKIFAPDDFVTEKNHESVIMQRGIMDLFVEMTSVMGPYGIWMGCGTRWGTEDAHAFLAGEYSPTDEAPKPIVTIKTEMPTTEGLAEGNATWPSVYGNSTAWLKGQLELMGPFKYSCLYDNNPTARQNTTFDMECTAYYQPRHLLLKRKTFPVHAVIDTSASTKHTSDKCAITVNALIQSDNRRGEKDRAVITDIYNLQTFTGRFSDDKIINILIALYDEYRKWKRCSGITFWMQEVVFEKKYKKLFHMLIQPQRPGFKIRKLPRSTVIHKWQEIGSLQPFHQNGQVFLPVRDEAVFEDLPLDDPMQMYKFLKHDARPLYQEMKRHVRGRRDQEDNCIDTLAQMVKIMQLKHIPAQDAKPEVLHTGDEEQRHRQKKAQIHNDFRSKFESGELGHNAWDAIERYKSLHYYPEDHMDEPVCVFNNL